MSDSLQPHGLQHARPPCLSPTPRVYSNSLPLNWWCHPTISSSVIPFSSHLQSFPASGFFQMSHFFASGGQGIGVSASASVLPMNIQDWYPLGWTGWISSQPKRLSRVFSNTTVQKHQFFGTQLKLPCLWDYLAGILEWDSSSRESVFPTKGSKVHLLQHSHWEAGSLPPSHLGNPLVVRPGPRLVWELKISLGPPVGCVALWNVESGHVIVEAGDAWIFLVYHHCISCQSTVICCICPYLERTPDVVWINK